MEDIRKLSGWYRAAKAQHECVRCGPNPRSALGLPSRRGKRPGPPSRRRADIIELAREYGRYGYRKIAAFTQAGERQAGGADLAARGGSKSPSSSPNTVVSARVCACDPSIASCMVLRLHRGSHARWEEVSHAQHARRVHPREPDDSRCTHSFRHRCTVRSSTRPVVQEPMGDSERIFSANARRLLNI